MLYFWDTASVTAKLGKGLQVRKEIYCLGNAMKMKNKWFSKAFVAISLPKMKSTSCIFVKRDRKIGFDVGKMINLVEKKGIIVQFESHLRL